MLVCLFYDYPVYSGLLYAVIYSFIILLELSLPFYISDRTISKAASHLPRPPAPSDKRPAPI